MSKSKKPKPDDDYNSPEKCRKRLNDPTQAVIGVGWYMNTKGEILVA